MWSRKESTGEKTCFSENRCHSRIQQRFLHHFTNISYFCKFSFANFCILAPPLFENLNFQIRPCPNFGKIVESSRFLWKKSWRTQKKIKWPCTKTGIRDFHAFPWRYSTFSTLAQLELFFTIFQNINLTVGTQGESTINNRLTLSDSRYLD